MASLLFLLRLTALAAGLTMCYGALFLYEREQALIQNTLEEWWIRVDDRTKSALSSHLAFMRVASQAVDRLLTRVFGHGIFSLRAAAMSILLSFVSQHLVTAIVAMRTTDLLTRASYLPFEPTKRGPWVDASDLANFLYGNSTRMHFAAVAALIVMIAASVTARWQRLPQLAATCLLIFFAYTLKMATLNTDWNDFTVFVLISLILGIAFDLVTIAIARKMIRCQAQTLSAVRLYSIAVAELLLIACLMIIPVWMGLWLIALGSEFDAIAFISLLVPLTNIPAALLSGGLFLTGALFLIHRVVWPVIARPLYQLARIGIFRSAVSRGLLFAAGSSLVAVGTGRTAPVVRALLKLLGSA